MATLYDINKEIESLVDTETGEVSDYEAFEKLLMDKNEKIENIALLIKNLKADAEAYKAEKEVFAKREQVAKNKIESLREYLIQMLDGNNFKSEKCALSFRRYEKAEVDDEFVLWAAENADDLLTYKTPTPNIKEIKELIKSGRNVPHVKLVNNYSLTIR